jgi:hypothetical protein
MSFHPRQMGISLRGQVTFKNMKITDESELDSTSLMLDY